MSDESRKKPYQKARGIYLPNIDRDNSSIEEDYIAQKIASESKALRKRFDLYGVSAFTKKPSKVDKQFLKNILHHTVSKKEEGNERLEQSERNERGEQSERNVKFERNERLLKSERNVKSEILLKSERNERLFKSSNSPNSFKDKAQEEFKGKAQKEFKGRGTPQHRPY
jgi:hypothetical protein